MYIYIDVLMSLIVLLFVTSGILIKYKRYYWLISGYNALPDARRGNVDLPGLGNFMGNSCFAIAVILLLAGIFQHLEVFYGVVISIASLFFAVALMLVRSQKYYRTTPIGGRKKISSKVVLSIIVIGLVIVGGMLIYGSFEQSIEVTAGKIEIGGLYATTLEADRITGVSIVNQLPTIQGKTNGFDFVDVLKGGFIVERMGEGKLFVNLHTPPFIRIDYGNSFIFLNFKDSTTTRRVFNEIRNLTKVD